MCVGEPNGGGRLTGGEDINDHGRCFVVRWSFGAARRENSMRGSGSKAIEENEKSVVGRPCSPRACGMSQPQRIVQSHVKPPSVVGIRLSIPWTSRIEGEGGLFVLVLSRGSCLPEFENFHSPCPPTTGTVAISLRPTEPPSLLP